MNGNDLLKAMSFVDEKYIDEADKPAARRIRWKPIAAMAACFCLILLAARVWRPIQNLQKVETAVVMEAAKSAVAEEAMLDLASNSFSAAMPLTLSMTVRTVSLSDGILTCVVTDQATSSFAADEIVKLSLTEEQQQEWLPGFEDTREMLSLTVTFLPEDGELIHPVQIVVAED